MKPILHIGLGKTSTSFLQEFFFPYIMKFSDRFYWKDSAELTNKILGHRNKMIQGKEIEKIILPNNIFVSLETLLAPSGWDPRYYEKFADLNLKAFGSDCEIIITIRKPRDWLRSNYLRNIGKLNIIPESKFYLSNNDYKDYELGDVHCTSFALEKFSYENIYKIYSKKFLKVTLIKYEDLKKLEVWKNIIDLQIDNLDELDVIKKKVVNLGLSKNAIKTTFIFNKFLSIFNLSLEKIHKFKKKLRFNDNSNLLKKYYNIFLNFLDWKRFLRFLDKKVFTYQKYEIITSTFIDMQIERLENEYERISR